MKKKFFEIILEDYDDNPKKFTYEPIVVFTLLIFVLALFLDK